MEINSWEITNQSYLIRYQIDMCFKKHWHNHQMRWNIGELMEIRIHGNLFLKRVTIIFYLLDKLFFLQFMRVWWQTCPPRCFKFWPPALKEDHFVSLYVSTSFGATAHDHTLCIAFSILHPAFSSYFRMPTFFKFLYFLYFWRGGSYFRNLIFNRYAHSAGPSLMVRCCDTWMLWDKGLVGSLIANISSRLKRNMRSKSIRKVEITLCQTLFA